MDPDLARRSLPLALTIVILLLAAGFLQYREHGRQERAKTAPYHLIVGSHAPELSAPTPNGPNLDLSDLKARR